MISEVEQFQIISVLDYGSDHNGGILFYSQYAAASVYNEEPLIDPTTWIRSKSYDFGFQSAYGSREESADERGSVTGSYQILDAQVKIDRFKSQVYNF